MEMSETQIHILVNALMSACGFVVCYNIIPKFKTMFINARLFGIDMSKRDKRKMWVLACAMLWTKQISFVAFVIRLCKGIFFICHFSFIDISLLSPESQGMICGAIFLVIMFLFIPVPFYKHILTDNSEKSFPHHEVCRSFFVHKIVFLRVAFWFTFSYNT